MREITQDTGVFDDQFVTRILQFQPFFLSCMMVSRAAFLEAGGWDEGVSRIMGCDLATTLRVAAWPPVVVVRCPIVAIRKHASNFSDMEKMNLGDTRVLDYVLRSRPEPEAFKDDIQRSVALRRQAALDSVFLRRDFSTARDVPLLLPSANVSAKQRIKSEIATCRNRSTWLSHRF